jgi:adenosine deaminase
MRSFSDLHRHLDGSIRPSTLSDLASERGFEVPSDLVFRPGMGLDEALSRFAFTLSLLERPEEVRRIASEICEDAVNEGVSTLEIRFAPQLHRGADPATIVDAAVEGAKGRAGIVLCGLYGEPVSTVSELVAIASTRPGVVGIDLAGGPSPAHAVRLADYAPAFARAKALGLGRTVHAAEGRSPSEIRVAIEVLGAQRIGHGTTLLEDAAVADLVIVHGVTIEACPTSNVHTGVIRSVDEHPLPKWLARGVRACINTDNTLLSAVNAPEEYARARAMPGMSDELFEKALAFGHAAAFRR